MGRHNAYDAATIDALFEARAQGVSARDIGARLGMTGDVVLDIVARLRRQGDPRAAYLRHKTASLAELEALGLQVCESANRRHLDDLARGYPAGPEACASLRRIGGTSQTMPARSIPLLHSPQSCGLD
jgi:hypothetical protein